MTPVPHDLGLRNRIAIFVDAGWLLAAATLEVASERGRHHLRWDYGGLISALIQHVQGHSGGSPLLRTYWYDGAPDGAPSHVHDRIAALPYVKLRLGRLSAGGEQKGVDWLIYHDLHTLARERAIDRAYLVAGDEDLREGVVEAQKAGLQVVLMGMPISEGQNQSAHLVRDCDEYTVLPRGVWAPFCTERPTEDDEPTHEDVVAARRLARAFAQDWVNTGEPERTEALLAALPQLPPDVDVVLIQAVEEGLGSLRKRPTLKQEIRRSFGAQVSTLVTRRSSSGGAE